MIIKNKSKKTVLNKHASYSYSLLAKSVGLIGQKKAKAIVLTTRFGIHTFGLRFPIDVIILNNKNEVVVLKKALHPNRIFMWNPKYKQVIELPNKAITLSKTTINDIITII